MCNAWLSRSKENKANTNTIKKTRLKKDFIQYFDKQQVNSRDVTREMKAKYDKQVSDLKLHYDKILLENDKELYELKNFKKESDYITGQLMYDAKMKHKRALEQSLKIRKGVVANKKDLQKRHVSELE